MSSISLHYTSGINSKDVKLEKLELYKEEDCGYFLSAKFKIEDEHSIRELDIPRIKLSIDPTRIYINQEYDPYCRTDITYINLGFGDLPLWCKQVNGNPVMYTEKILEEKYTEMTMDEIEKKLGYKVKIVNK